MKNSQIVEWNYVTNQESLVEVIPKMENMKFYSQFNRIVGTVKNKIQYNIN